MRNKDGYNAQGIKLPLLPVVTLEKKSLFTRHYSIVSKKIETELTICWCNHVDGVHNFPKVHVHFRTHLRNCLKKNRIKNSVKAAKKGANKLKNINKALSPCYSN